MDDFDALYAAHFASLTTQLFAYFGDRQEAQDVVQEAFSRAWPRWESISRYEEPAAWIRRVAWNEATSRWRRLRTARAYARQQRRQLVAGPEPDRVALVDALRTLPPNHRRAVVLFYLADLSVADIAADCGVTPSTVKSWLHRARAALADQLNDAEGVPSRV